MFYSASKICPNIHQPFQRKAGADCNDRTFIIPACGGFQIVDNVSCLREYFNSDELVIAADRREWIELFGYYISRPEEREKIIRKGMARVIKDHTYFDRLELLAGYLENIQCTS